MSSSSPSSPRQWNATRSPLPASTWRSRQLWETLSLPSWNHLKNGGFESSSASVGSSNQSSSSVRLLQPPPGRVLLRLLVHRQVGDEGVLDEVLGRLEALLLEQIARALVRGCLPRLPSLRSLSSGRGRSYVTAGVPAGPPGRTSRSSRPAKDAYHATSAVASPTQPPSFMMPVVRTGVADPEQEERDGQEEEDRGDRGRRAQRRDEHVGREDAPRDEVQADGVAGVGRRDLRRRRTAR